jgi:membrane protein
MAFASLLLAAGGTVASLSWIASFNDAQRPLAIAAGGLLAGVAAVGFLLLVSMLLTAALAAIGKFMGGLVPEPLMQAVGFLVSFAVIAVMFALLFKWMPDAEVRWRDVVVGAIGTAALFEVGKFAIGFYIGKQGLESTYGASASIVVVLIWVYYSAQIVLFGAEFTHARAEQRRSADS